MSADNGVYVLVTKAPPIKQDNCYTNQHGKKEYRVAHCQAIDNLDYSDLYMPLLFGDSKVYESEDDARTEANRLADDIFYLEYGISWIEKGIYFPNMTSRAARKALDCYVGADPLDCEEEEDE